MDPLRAILLISIFGAFAAVAMPPTQENIVYGEAGGEKLTMDYYAPSGQGPHPIVIIIHGGGFVGGTSKNNSEAYCADFLAPAGYSVLSINYRLAPKYPYPAMVDDVVESIRYARSHAHDFAGDPNRIALLGGSAGGYLSNMAGLLNAPGAQVQAVVTLFGPSDFRGKPMGEYVHALLDGFIKQRGDEKAAIAEASPITHVSKNAPPFLLIHGDKDEAVAFTESTNLQAALLKAGAKCELIRIPNGPHATGSWHKVPGVPDWERQMTEWLNKTLKHRGPIGQGIRPRQAS
ncbi:MAG: alpha/beta hydrolase [Bryobacteraceae bacterium]